MNHNQKKNAELYPIFNEFHKYYHLKFISSLGDASKYRVLSGKQIESATNLIAKYKETEALNAVLTGERITVSGTVQRYYTTRYKGMPEVSYMVLESATGQLYSSRVPHNMPPRQNTVTITGQPRHSIDGTIELLRPTLVKESK